MAVKYTQEERIFIQRATMQGFSMDQIEKSITNRKAKQSFWGKAAEAEWLPAIPATIAAGIGFVGAGPAGAAYGAVGGWGLGEMLRQEAATIRGRQFGEEPLPKEEALKQVGGQIRRPLTAGAGAYTLTQLLGLGKAAFRPKKTVAGLRTTTLAGKTIPTKDLERNVMQNLEQNKDFQQAPSEVQRLARQRASQFLSKTTPLQTTGEGGAATIQQATTTGLNAIYENLASFERAGRAYEGVSVPSAADKLVSRATREYLTTVIPKSAQRLNKIYAALAKAEPYAKRAKYGAAGAAGAAAMWKILGPKLEDLFSGD